MKPFAVSIFVLALGSCTDAQERAPQLDQEGDPCRASQPICVDEHSARECIDGFWADRDCDEICAERGAALVSEGCVAVPDTQLEDCICVPEPGACAPNDTACESDTELAYCGAEQLWEIHDCDDLCADSLATPVSLGCAVDEDGVAVCWCVAEDPG